MPFVVDQETGERIEVPDHELGQAIASGRYAADPGTRIPVVDQSGKVGTLPIEDIHSGSAETAGFRLATGDEYTQAKLDKQYGTGMATVQAGAEATARGMSFGLSDVALRGLGMDAEGLRERRDRNPVVSTVGEVGGAVAPVLASGGTGALGLGLRGAGAIPRGVAAAGRAAERAVTAGLGQAAGRSMLGRGAALGAAATVEGGLYGLGQSVSGAALGEAPEDPAELAEYVLSHVGQGMLLGGATGGLIGVAGAGLARGVERGKSLGTKLLGRATREAVEDGVQVADGPLAKAIRAADAPVEERSILQAAQAFPEESAAKQAWPAHRSKASVSLREKLTEIEKHADVVTQSQTIADKYRAAADLMQGAPPTASFLQIAKESHEVIGGIKAELQQVLKSPRWRAKWEVTGAKRLMDKIAEHEKLIADAFFSGQADAPAKMFASMDMIKREMGNVQGAMRVKGGSGVREQLRIRYDEPLKLLEREDLWGKGVAEMQRRENAAWVPFLDTSSAYRQDFLTRKGGGRSVNQFDELSRSDSGKIDSFVSQFGTEANFNREDILIRTVESRNQLLQELASRPSASEPVKQAAREADRLAKEVQNIIGETREISKRAQAYDATRERAESMLGGKALFKAAETAAVSYRTAGGTLQAMARLQGVHAQVSQQVSKAASAAVEATKAVALRAGQAAPVAAVALAEGKGTRRERFERTHQIAAAYRANPVGYTQHVARQIQAVHAVDPTTASAMAAAATRGAEFLANKMPRPNVRQSTLRPDLDKTQRVSDADMARFLRYATAVERPMSVIEAVARGDVTREGIETLRVVYPTLHRQLVRDVGKHVGQLKKTPPYSRLQQLSVILERPTHPSMEPQAMVSAQQSYAQAAEQRQSDVMAPSARKGTALAESHQTKTQRIAR
jgi:hypothetical protein